jgi:hypothetical protein
MDCVQGAANTARVACTVINFLKEDVMTPKYRVVAAISTALFASLPGAVSALTCADLDGAYVVSEESPQVYLGFFGSPSAVDSIENPFGTYGNPSSVGSVRNTSGPYGSSSGAYSANNPSASTPPLFGKFEAAIGYLSNNTFLSGSVSLASIDASCGTNNFVSMQPAANPASITIRPGISGNWDDPTVGQEGHGFQFEILPNNGILVIWFVFTPDGTGQTWLYSQGSYDPASNTVMLPTYVSTGQKFPPNYKVSDRHLTQWGTLTFTFTDCNRGTASWTSTAAGYPPSGSFPIARVTKIAGTTCP